MIMPDTSPRGEGIPNDDNYDLGQGAGFYIDATNDPWNQHFKMESYITKELTDLVERQWDVGTNGVRSICGHSMGGHGALTLAFKNPNQWISVSAFAPICHPTACPWGKKAFENYLGSIDAGRAHDATLLLTKSLFDDILIDEGSEDIFAKEGQLLLADFEAAAMKVGQKLTVRRQAGHDHSYHTIAAFIDEHVGFHAKRLRIARNKLVALAAENDAATVAAAGTAGKPIQCKAMVARGPNQLACEEITVDPPKAGEVRVKVVANGTLSVQQEYVFLFSWNL